MRLRFFIAMSLIVAACGIDATGTGPAAIPDGTDGAPVVGKDGSPPTGDATVTDADITDAAADVVEIPSVDAAGYPGPPITVDINGCPGGRGSGMVKKRNVCFDGREATVADYGDFLNAVDGGAATDLTPECKAKTTHIPGVWNPAGGGATNIPVVNVDWCDADSFCRWAGKRLCGDPNGGPLKTNGGHLNSAGKDPWYDACSNGGANTYPYGTAYSATQCNTGQGALSAAIDPYPCEGSVSGLHDMIGNAKEHANTCDGDNCLARGGSFRDSSTTTCSATSSVKRDTRADDMGIRCCAYLP